MSLTINTYPASMALTGNPVKLIVNSSSLATYAIKDGETTIYTGSGEGDFSVFIQEVLAGVVNPSTLPNESADVLMTDTGTTKNIRIDASNTEGNSASVFITAVIGGVSKRTLRRLNDEFSNVFTWKLLNSSTNFFKTTRTNSRIITIRETELLPISFLYPDVALKVVAGGVTTALPGTPKEPRALNLYRLRNNLFHSHNILASVFDIYAGDVKACTIVITPGTLSRERYLLEFLNSYGAYERIEVTGIGNIESEITTDQTYQVYDEIIDDYIDARERQTSKDKLLVESGYHSSEELIHLMDMLASDDIKILGLDGRNIRVNAIAENLAYASRATVPESLKLTLQFVDSDARYTGSLSDDELGNPRIHTEQFSQQFN